MLFTEFEQHRNNPDAPAPDPSLKVERAADGLCVVDGLYPLALEASSELYPAAHSIQVLDENGLILGELLTCQGEEFNIPRFSAGYLASYLADIPSMKYGLPGTFSSDYLLIRTERLDEYRTHYGEGSPVWGGFQHMIASRTAYVVTSVDPIRATRGIRLPTEIHVEAAARSVMQPFAFERYLKLYHLLELSFDLHIVQKIQALKNDLRGIGQIFSSLESQELNRLKLIIQECKEPTAVIECIRKLVADPQWWDGISSIFFEFGKSGNPLTSDRHRPFLDAIKNGYTFDNIQPVAGIQGGRPPSPAQQKAFEVFSLNLAAYWIYRVRSSIAHNRIGEYVMRDEDEPFVSFFAEPLIRCVLAQVL
jgi:hypothetical protein